MDYSGADLLTAYQALQLDPANTQRLAAFKSLCWKHILHYAPPGWVQYAQSGIIPLAWRSGRGGPKGGGQHQECDDTLDSIVYEFIRLYADIIWPLDITMRAHLAPNMATAIRAVPMQIRARREVIERLERLRGVRATDRVCVVESRIGRKVREFLKELVLTTGVPLFETRSAERLLLLFLGRETLLVPAYASGEALRAHQQLGHPVRMHAAIVIDLTNDDDDDLSDTHEDEPSGAGLVSLHSSVGVQTTPGNSSGTTKARSAHYPIPNVSREQISSRPETLAIHNELDHPVTTHTAPSVSQTPQDGRNGSASLPWDVWFPNHQSSKQTVSKTPVHPKITSARYPCLHAGCGRVYAWSEALVTHQDLGHPAVPQVIPQTDHQDLAHLMVPRVAQQAEPTIENSTSGKGLVTVIDLVGSESDDEDGEEETRGLLCPHDGCPLRFLDWATFDAHAQLPHDGDVYASSGRDALTSNSGNMHNTNNVEDVDNLLQAVETPVIEERHIETSSSGVQSAPNRAESQSGDMTRWRSMSGGRA